MTEIVQTSKRETHTHTKKQNSGKRYVWMKIFGTPRFFRTIPLPTPAFLWEKSDPRSFSRILRTGGGGSFMVAALKRLKLMQFQRNFFHFKGLKLRIK